VLFAFGLKLFCIKIIFRKGFGKGIKKKEKHQPCPRPGGLLAQPVFFSPADCPSAQPADRGPTSLPARVPASLSFRFTNRRAPLFPAADALAPSVSWFLQPQAVTGLESAPPKFFPDFSGFLANVRVEHPYKKVGHSS